MSLFPVPVSGQQIPRGWFARLVRYMNSLFLRGDGSYLAVSHTPGGTFIRPTPYLIDRLNKAASAPASGGGTNQDISASVSGGTAFVTLSGSPSAIEFVGTGDVTLSGNTNGQIEINATGGGSTGFPDYFSSNIVDNLSFFTVYGPYNNSVWLIGKVSSVIAGDELRGDLTVWVFGGTNSKRIDVFNADLIPIDTFNTVDFGSLVIVPIPAGNSFRLDWVGNDPNISDLKIYPCI